MPAILAIETSSDIASVALTLGDRLIAREAPGVQTHSQSILPMVQEVLAQAGMPLSRCDAIAFGAGPGSFTGVRTACGVAQGLAFGSGLPLVPVVTLMAMAQACREQARGRDVLAVLDARMDEVYWAQYRYEDGWHAVIEPTLSPPSGVAPDGDVLMCGNGLTAYAQAFGMLTAKHDMQAGVMPHAAQTAELARLAFTRGETVAARDAQPLYLRNKVALTTLERMARAAA